MGHDEQSRVRIAAVDGIFDHPAFAPLKAREAAFVVVRASDGELVWANAAAARAWGRTDTAGQIRIFPPGSGATAGRTLGTLLRGGPMGPHPRLGRLRLARGFRLQNDTVLFRAGPGPDGALLFGFALPETAMDQDRPAVAWRRGSDDGEALDDDNPPEAEPVGTPAGPVAEAVEAVDHESAGLDLAQRSQVAVLRDRLQAAVDGATSLRLLWRTDEHDRVTQIDTGLFRRLGVPVLFDQTGLAAAVAHFDEAASARLAAALATRATWSAVALRLPVADGGASVPMTLSASPMFGPSRAFAGFRGFGTIDLASLERGPSFVPAHRREPESGPSVEAAPAEIHDAPQERLEPDGIAAAQDVEPVMDAPSDPDPTSTSTSSDQGGSAANVVHLRPFQTGAGRFGTPTREGAAAEASVPASLDEDSAAASSAEPDHDDEAFQALRDALLAQIAPAATVETAEPATPDTAATADESPSPQEQESRMAMAGPEAGLIDELPVGVLVIRGGLPVFANRMAAARLGYAAVADLVGVGAGLVVSEAKSEIGTVLLRDVEGRAVAIPAEGRPSLWQGGDATLWTFGLPVSDRAGSAPAAGADRAAGRPEEDGHNARDLLDRVDDAVALLDVEGRVRRLNRQGEIWFARHGSDGILGQSFTQMLAPDSRAAGLALLGDVKAQKEGATAAPLQGDVVARAADLTTLPMLLTLGRLGTSGFYATLRDVTALKRAERDKARIQRDHERDLSRLPEFLAKVSHEVRTPLNAILGFAEVMMDERFGPLGNVRYKDYLKDIHTSGTQVVSLVSDLLDLSRIEAGRIDLEVGALDVNKIVADTVALMQPEAHRERVIMRMSLGARTPAVLADERSVRQIVQNLLSNAVKFNEPGGQVIVSTALSDGGTVVLRVRDTGIGMTDAEVAAALEPFQPASAQKPSTGNGLGLPLTRALVGANGASMAIRSRPQEGTLVEVAFALASPDATRRPA